MTLQQLKYFRVMADVLHYTKASKILYVSQPTLSYSISEMEKELGAPLFEKQGNKTVLTKYGAEFLPYAQKALESIEEGFIRIEKMRMPSSEINLGYIYSISFDFLPRVLMGFCKQPGNGDTSFNFFQGPSPKIIEKLKKAELDIALTVNAADESIESLPVYEQNLFAVVPKGHPLTQKAPVSIEALKEEKFVAIKPNSSLRQHIDNVFENENFTPNIVFEAEECNAMASFVGARFGIAIMPEIPALHAYDVDVLPIADKQFTRGILLAWVKARPLTPAAARFRDYLTKNSGAFLAK